jgi:hypothetical protein
MQDPILKVGPIIRLLTSWQIFYLKILVLIIKFYVFTDGLVAFECSTNTVI